MAKQNHDTKSKRDSRREKKEIKWDKLDNTAHIFPVIAGEYEQCVPYIRDIGRRNTSGAIAGGIRACSSLV